MTAAATLWELVTAHLGHRVTIHGLNDTHTGVLQHVLLRPDGSLVATFEDDTTLATPARSAR